MECCDGCSEDAVTEYDGFSLCATHAAKWIGEGQAGLSVLRMQFRMVVEPLEKLVALKRYKDKYGKGPDYEEQKKKAWEQAESALIELGRIEPC